MRSAALVRYAYADIELRARHRSEHLKMLEDLARGGVVALAGPTRDQSGAFVILNVTGESAARKIMDADPYVVHGAVTDYTVEVVDVVIDGTVAVRTDQGIHAPTGHSMDRATTEDPGASADWLTR